MSDGGGVGHSRVRKAVEIVGLLTATCEVLGYLQSRHAALLLASGAIVASALLTLLAYRRWSSAGRPERAGIGLLAAVLMLTALALTWQAIGHRSPGTGVALGSSAGGGAGAGPTALVTTDALGPTEVSDDLLDTGRCGSSCLQKADPLDVPRINDIAYPAALYADLTCGRGTQTFSADVQLDGRYRQLEAVLGLDTAPVGVPVRFTVSSANGVVLSTWTVTATQVKQVLVAVRGMSRVTLTASLASKDASSDSCPAALPFLAVWGDPAVLR